MINSSDIDSTQPQNSGILGLISEDELSKREANAREVWVISEELRQDQGNPLIKQQVISNLSIGTSYRYFFPSGETRKSYHLAKRIIGFVGK